MHETTTCRYCHKQITRRRLLWLLVGPRTGVDHLCREAPASVLYHQPATEDGRPESGPYLLHVGVHVEDDDREQPIPALASFATDGDSFVQWCEPFDGTQRFTVRLDALPDDDDLEDFAVEKARELRAAYTAAGVPAYLASWASYTVADGDWSEWDITVATCSA